MNIFNKVTLQGMKKSRTRTIVTIIGVVLSAAMITGVATFCVSMMNYMVKGATHKYGDWHVQFPQVNSSFVQQQTLDKRVKNTATFENIGYGKLVGGKNPNKPYIFIAGFNKKTFDTLPITLVSGRLPKNSGEILIPEHVDANGGVKFSIGDKLSLAVGNRILGNKSLNQHDPYISGGKQVNVKETLLAKAQRTYTVVGICERPGFEEASAPGYTLITEAATTYNADNLSLFVKLKNPRGVNSYASHVAGTKAYALNDNVLRFMGLSNDTFFNTFLYSVGFILVALTMLGSIFLIYNSFNISLNERTRQFGILSSVGATAKQLRNSVLFEGFCIGAIGIPLGVIVGIGSMGLVLSFIGEKFRSVMYSSVNLTLTISFSAIVVAAVVSMITILISAYIPARKAAKTPVMESIRQTNEVKVDNKTVKTSKLAERLYGLEGTLALKNFKRNKKRYRSIVLSLSLSIVLFVTVSSFGTNLKQTAEQSTVHSDFDICFSTQDMGKKELFRLYDKLKTAKGVYKSSYQAIMTYSCGVKASNFSYIYRKDKGYNLPNNTVTMPIDLQFIRDKEYLNFIKKMRLPINEYYGQNAKMIAVAKAKEKLNPKNDQFKLIDMFANRSANLTMTPQINGQTALGQGKNLNFTFVDTYPIDLLPKSTYEVRPYTFVVVAPYKLKEKFNIQGTHIKNGLTFNSKNSSESVTEMKEMIKASGITSEYNLYNFYKMLEDNRNTTFIADVFAYIFVIMISLIATANVFNTISTNIKFRRRELAMLRSVGMSDKDFKKMMNFECIFYGMKALLTGLPIAGILSYLIYSGMTDGESGIGFKFPWVSMLISTFCVFFIVFITMLYSISKIKKENIIDALRDDMT